ncbi:MAG: hypothetical protein B1H12_11335 [Desulfobacteraceae bacterium 4484_190.2]|nr:MAG: hypothetical protein B1H12_11335 [Desulfobacteraceae bacterium 4484_190.2]
MTGDNACVKWSDGLWYHAQVTDISEGHIRVHYTGYDQSNDEWVSEGSALPVFTPQINDIAWVFWKDGWTGAYYFEGRIIDKNSTGYKVHYITEGNDTSLDEWKGLCDVFPLPEAGDYLWVSPLSSAAAYGIVLAHTDTETWNVHYGGYCKEQWCSGDEWYAYDEEFSPPDIIPASPDEQKIIKEEFDDHSPVDPPSGIQSYSFAPVESPDILNFYYVSTPSKIKPIGLGKVVNGGQTMDVSFDIPDFKEAINIYFAVFLENINVSAFSDATLHFYLVASNDSDLSNSYIWTTSFSTNQTGHFTGKKNSCMSTDIISMVQPIIHDMESRGNQNWYDQLEAYIAQYKDADGNENPLEALNKIALAAYGENNVYPFCWATLKRLQLSPGNPWALNAAAVCMFELDKNEQAGMLLDCAYKYDAELSITYSNGGVYYKNKGDTIKALESFNAALGKSPASPHRAWDAYHYAKAKSQTAYQNIFLNKIPENYSTKNNDGSTGKGEKQLIVCCNCNGKIYQDLGECLDECSVSLACFTHICSPRLECCNGNGPFGFEGGICYPPTGLQVCIEKDNQGNTTVKVGGDLFGIISGYIGASSNFKSNHTLFIEGSAASGKHTLTMLTTDPNTKNWSSQHRLTMSKKLGGGISFAANTQPSQWSKSMLCELYTQ